MKRKSENLKSGLDALLNPVTDTKDTAKAEKPDTAAKDDKPTRRIVCYSISAELADKIRYIAWYDRKKINEVVEDAFMKYINDWNATAVKAKNIK